MKVCVLGAGIVGATTAYQLTEAGFDVTVIDRQPRAAMETSFANGGQLSVSNALPWGQPGMPGKMLKWLLQKDSGLFFRPWFSRAELRWILGFFRNCRADAAARNTARLIEICARSCELYRQLAARENIEFDFLEKGALHLFFDQNAYEHARQSGKLLLSGPHPRRVVVDAAQVVKIEPALEPVAHRIIGGFYSSGDATGDAHKFSTALARICAQRGATFIHGDSVTGVSPERDGIVVHTDRQILRFDHAVCCLGVESAHLLRKVGVATGVYPVKGYSITIDLPEHAAQHAAPTVSLLDEERRIVVSRLGLRLRVAGIAELDGYNLRIRDRRIQLLRNWVRATFPQLQFEQVVAWAGLRPATPSNLPRVGRTRHPRLWLNTGHGSLGWTAAMATAETVVYAIINDTE